MDATLRLGRPEDANTCGAICYEAFKFAETEPGVEGFIEDGWLKGTLEVGGSVRIVQMRSALRCVMTTHRQADLVRDMRILRTAAHHHHNQVGVWASIGAPGKVRVDDPVVLVM